MSKIFLSLLSLVMITVLAGCSEPATVVEVEGAAPAAESNRPDRDAEEAPAPEVVPAPEPAPAPEAAPAVDGAASEEAPAPSASAAPLTGTKWA